MIGTRKISREIAEGKKIIYNTQLQKYFGHFVEDDLRKGGNVGLIHHLPGQQGLKTL